jgi:hypothetical protein
MAALLVERATHPVGPLFWGRGLPGLGDWIRESVITYIIYLMNDWQPLTSWLGRK